MEERYVKLKTNTNQLYVEGSPVILSANALLKDKETGKIIQQNKFENISGKTIIAMYVDVIAYTIAKDEIEGVEEYQYLDLEFKNNSFYGSQIPIFMPKNVTRNTKILIKRVFFEDGTQWKADSIAEWETIKEETERKPYSDLELEKQFKIEYGNNYRYVPEKYKDLWRCPCGIVNKLTSDTCRNCGMTQDVFKEIDLDALEKTKDERLERERLEAEKASKKKEAQKKIAKKVAAIGIPSAVAVIVVVVLLFNVIIPNIKYSNACSLMEQRNYAEALATFKEIENTNDSQSLIFECEKNVLKSASVGDVVTFGKENGTFIEWTVLENSNGKVLIAKNTIDTNTIVKHGECADILNGYIQSYFTDSERGIIADNKLILLSKDNVKKWDTATCYYWLSDSYTETKTTGSGKSKASVTYNGFYYVTTSGNVSQTTKLSDTCCVRAAAYINVN